jgi:hypothetical protein
MLNALSDRRSRGVGRYRSKGDDLV